MKSPALKFTVAETRHLLQLLHDSTRVGEYYGNRDQYWNRHQRVTEKLTNHLPQDKQNADSCRDFDQIHPDSE